MLEMLRTPFNSAEYWADLYVDEDVEAEAEADPVVVIDLRSTDCQAVGDPVPASPRS